MKPILLVIALLFILASCTKYQYLTVTGVNIPKNEKNELISENDTVRVQYFFKEAEGPVVVRIYNKTKEPLEVDWRKSAIIINDRPLSYYDPSQSFNGQIETTTRRFLGSTTTSGGLRGELQSGEQLQFVPPLSYIDSRPLNFASKSAYRFAEETAAKVIVEYPNHRVLYKCLKFEKEVSPAQFRSFLTLRIGQASVQKEVFLEHQFYISEIWRSGAAPSYFSDSLANRSDRFYIFK